MELFILVIIFISIITAVIINIVNKRNLHIVKERSKVIKGINSLNEKFQFNNIVNDIIPFTPKLKSKSALENLNIYEYVMDQIERNQNYYMVLFNEIEENIKDYKEYEYEYSKIKKITPEDEFSKFEGLKIKYKTFVKYEEKLYYSLKQKSPVTDIFIKVHATYTSPSGRNHYWIDESYDYDKIKEMLRDIEQRQELKRLEKEIKEKIAAEKRAKEKRLRELDKLEKKLKEKEIKQKLIDIEQQQKSIILEEKIKEKRAKEKRAKEKFNKIEMQLKEKEERLTQKEKEFQEATRGHIYSTERTNVFEEEYKGKTKYQLLKDLRKQFENGEITKEEYNSKRKELI